MGPLFVGISHKDVLFEGDEYTRDEAVNDINQLIQEKSTILLCPQSSNFMDSRNGTQGKYAKLLNDQLEARQDRH